ncbi:MAG: type VI secretion system protein ImpC [Lentimonas sp.]|jgi:type VI secretion system protein ImpC
MRFQADFGNPNKKVRLAESGKFRLAVLGDFSGRANKGELETGDALAKRKPLNVHFDNIDDIIARLNIAIDLPIGGTGSTRIEINSMDDFHPDELYEKLEIFAEISNLRDRLRDTASFVSAAKEVQEWLGDKTLLKTVDPETQARGSTIPAKDSLNDFSKLVGESTVKHESVSSAIENLLKNAVAPYIEPSADPRQEAMVAAVDGALSGMMRSILHHPDFQIMESLWRSVELLTQRLETDTHLQIVLYDMTAEEVAADLAGAESLKDTGLYKLFIEQPILDEQQGPLSAIAACYTFEQTASHADLLKRIAQIAAESNTPFVASISLDSLSKEGSMPEWEALHSLPAAAYLGLTVPQFMLRTPYGKKSEPIEPFEFEEFTDSKDLSSLLWGHSSILAGLSLGLSYTEQGLSGMDIHSNVTIGEMPFHYYNDSDGDQIALPCTEQLFTETLISQVINQNLMPIVSIRGQPQVQLGSWGSLGGKNLAGPWAPVEIPPIEDTPQAAPAAASPVVEEPVPEATAESTPVATNPEIKDEAISNDIADPEEDSLDEAKSNEIGDDLPQETLNHTVNTMNQDMPEEDSAESNETEIPETTPPEDVENPPETAEIPADDTITEMDKEIDEMLASLNDEGESGDDSDEGIGDLDLDALLDM